MKVASYKSRRKFPLGIGNLLIQLRLRGKYSHTELVFEPHDAVGDLLPDGTTEQIDGTLWSCSAVALEKLPEYSKKRAGRYGGVRFKRIKFDPKKWDMVDVPSNFDPREACTRVKQNEGAKYDWFLVSSFVAWFIPQSKRCWDCNEVVGFALGFKDSWRYDPCSFHECIKLISDRFKSHGR